MVERTDKKKKKEIYRPLRLHALAPCQQNDQMLCHLRDLYFHVHGTSLAEAKPPEKAGQRAPLRVHSVSEAEATNCQRTPVSKGLLELE